MFIEQMVIGTLMIIASAIFHVSCLVGLAKMLSLSSAKLSSMNKFSQGFVLVNFSVLFVVLLHTIEIWGWAWLYMALGEFSELSQALYFSTVTSTTLGYGDIVLSEKNQLLSAFESMGGLILFGVSTAFFLSVMKHLFDNLIRGNK